MPGQGQQVWSGALRSGPVVALTLLLAGCVGGGSGGSKFGFGSSTNTDQASLAAGGGVSAARQDAESRSAVIGDLLSRQTILTGNGAYAQIAQSVIEANSGPARAELRVARLKAEARSKNWLPSIKPSLSLTDLGETFASLIVEQVLFDGGGRKAERAFAAADVEVAATSLALDYNQRVYEGLNLYIVKQRALEQAGLADRAAGRMAEFERIVTIRVDGGMSDRSEQQVIQQKAAEMRATASNDRFQAAQAMAELNTMASRDLGGVSGLGNLPADANAPEPLSVVKARAEATRTQAEAEVVRAGYRPGLKGIANINQDGDIESGLSVEFDNALGLGTGAELDALAMTKEVTDRRVAKTAEQANRDIVALQHEIATLTARQSEGASVLAQGETTLAMFTEQFKVGRRTLMELVNMFESVTAMQREQAGLKYEIALKRLQIARDRGILVSGAAL
ncbi:TolC family protein [Gemmobacter serpentinus]|uniref:TolC family protein n=1 Tax=Gemmobacter serpentinus TaxID=2652247 RepID=UPI00186570CD|nr:TolC family protein [Gemmobacter serpentinus]